MRDERKGENTNADRWHAGPARETLGAWPSLLMVLRVDYIFSVSLDSRLPVYKQKEILENGEMTAAHARWPVASVVSGKWSGVSGGG
jgi:hypothetical protein